MVISSRKYAVQNISQACFGKEAMSTGKISHGYFIEAEGS